MDWDELEEKINYRFKNEEFLEEALSHSSYVNEHPEEDLRSNERLEFLGDAVLNLVVGELLMKHFTDVPEGNLSRMRANLVNEVQLAKLAKKIELGKFLRLGKGEIQSKGQEKKSILADAFEALIAAIYLDGGLKSAFKFIQSSFSSLIDSKSKAIPNFDYKSKLQEIVQMSHKVTPVYQVVREMGPDHDKTFLVQINLQDLTTQGIGKSKKMAEQDAARKALEII